MSSVSSIRWEKERIDAFSSRPQKHHVSVMRDFLESDVDFEWPANLGECSGNHCDISGDVGKIPLKWKGFISDKTNASIDMYEAGPDFCFKKSFVVKTIRDTDSRKARKMTAKEVENMKDLRHPHVAALLGTFTFQARLHILIFPAACCDLDNFMRQMSSGFDKDRIASHSDSTNTIDRDTTVSKLVQESKVTSASKYKEHDAQEIHSEFWPLTLPVDEKIKLLRSYFVCLSQALSYLHGSGVRHKDIKPENILIDESGSAILTDFGISRRFPKHTPHATNNERNFTRKYASPEMMEDETTFRDDPSDVFSLGCVFLEMATLLLGNNLHNLSDHYATIVNDSSKEEAYHCNLGNVHSWIDYLRTSRGFKPVQEHWLPGARNEVPDSDPSPDNHMTAALVDIREMLDEIPSKRPKSEGLWQRFQHISAMRCRDCDPRRPVDIWKPSARQRRDAQTGLHNRRSLHAIEKKDLKSRELPVSGFIDSTRLSARLEPSVRKAQKNGKHGHIRTRSEPDSPISKLNGDTPAHRAEAASAPSSRVLIQHKEEMIPEGTRPEVAQSLAHSSPGVFIHDTSTDIIHQIPDDVELTQSLRLSRPQATKFGLSHRRAARLGQQSRTTHRKQATRDETSVPQLERFTPPPQARIIVYDVSQTIAFETVFASLKDQEPQKYRLPRFRRKVEIGHKADLIAKVDLGQLKIETKMRRWMGSFPWIYVLNYAAQPLQQQTG